MSGNSLRSGIGNGLSTVYDNPQFLHTKAALFAMQELIIGESTKNGFIVLTHERAFFDDDDDDDDDHEEEEEGEEEEEEEEEDEKEEKEEQGEKVEEEKEKDDKKDGREKLEFMIEGDDDEYQIRYTPYNTAFVHALRQFLLSEKGSKLLTFFIAMLKMYENVDAFQNFVTQLSDDDKLLYDEIMQNYAGMYNICTLKKDASPEEQQEDIIDCFINTSLSKIIEYGKEVISESNMNVDDDDIDSIDSDIESAIAADDGDNEGDAKSLQEEDEEDDEEMMTYPCECDLCVSCRNIDLQWNAWNPSENSVEYIFKRDFDSDAYSNWGNIVYQHFFDTDDKDSNKDSEDGSENIDE